MTHAPRRKNPYWQFAQFGILAVAVVGCEDTHPRTYPAGGTVRFDDGTPIRFGVVNLVPEAAGPSARAKIGTDGKFDVGTFEATDGALAGQYRVLIVQHLPSAENVRAAPADHEHAQDSTVPLPYSQLESTPLAAEIVPDGKNRLELVVERADRTP